MPNPVFTTMLQYGAASLTVAIAVAVAHNAFRLPDMSWLVPILRVLLFGGCAAIVVGAGGLLVEALL